MIILDNGAGRGRRQNCYFKGVAQKRCGLAVIKSPVPKELLELLATATIPQAERLVITRMTCAELALPSIDHATAYTGPLPFS
jgi:hypothetical protein